MKQKVIVIFLLSLWILQSTISSVLIEIERFTHHNVVFNENKTKQVVQKNSTTFIFNSVNQINWEVEGKEFTINNELYDVISIIENDGKIIVNCKSDKKEDSIIKKYKTEKTTPKKNTHKDLISLYFPEIEEYNTIPNTGINKDFYLTCQFLKESIYLPVISPPPEFLNS